MTSATRACGKVILLGEHAVVYGVPALAVGIDRGVDASATLTPGAPSRLRIEGGPTVEDSSPDPLGRAFRALLDAGNSGASVEVTLRSELPPGAGLGCSAAMGVAAARAIASVTGRSLSAEIELDHALAWERVFHGNPSGVDTTVAAMGGCVHYIRGQRPERVRLRGPLELAIGHSGQSASTKEMVEGVARLRERNPASFEKTLDAIRSLVANARLALEAGDVVGLGRLMDLNQMLLAGWMLSTSEIEALCSLARQTGALGVKLTGSGGGGCVVALCRGNAPAVADAWRSAGFDAFSTTVSG